MSDRRVDELLSRLGMPEYVRLFAEHALDWDVLPDITDADLEKLGLPLGHRRKLLRAIRGNPAHVHPPPLQAPTLQAPPPTLMEARAERRQITVMFCDMVGSTALASSLDPEDMMEILQRYQRACAGHVAEFGGRVAQYLGDGILAYFGYPQAHENDAERAVRAALAIIEAIGPLNETLDRRQRVAVAVRIGIATGVVVVGNIIGEAGAEERTAIGETPSLAARLQSIAPPDTVVVADGTRRLLGGGFEYEDLGLQRLAGFAKPERAWRVVRPIDARSRFEARRTPLLPFVGREPELRLLTDRWQRVQCGMGQVVVVCGEPGIGKSRLTLAFEDAIGVEPHGTIHFSCSTFHRNSALQPVIERLSRVAGLTPEDDAAARNQKLRHHLGGDDQSIELAVSMLSSLLSAGGTEAPPTGVSLQRQKDRTLASLVDGIEEAAARLPQLVVFEDLQWIDPTSHEFLDLLIERTAMRPILLLATCRPELAVPWSNRPHVTTLTLGRLNRRRTEDFVNAILDGKALPEPVLTQIVAKTGGVPLFVEELTKAVLESGLVRTENDHYVLDGPLPQRAIPATIHDSLMARLDQLALPKEIAQVGSVIGRRFSFRLLAAVTALPEAMLRESLDRLVASELVFCRGTPPASVYVFKHALVQDAAYESLLHSKRRHLHQRIAMVLESAFPESAETSPELIARHYSEAGDAEPAIRHWHLAAEKASRASAYTEALNHLRQGLAVLETLPEDEGRDIRELELQLPLATALLALKGAGAPEVEQVYARALQLCERLPESPLHFAAFWGWWRISMDFRTGRDRGDRLLALAGRLGESELMLQSHHSLWATNFMLGDHRACLHHIDCGLELYRADEHARLASIYGGHDTKVCAEGEAALSLWILGHGGKAMQRIEHATSWARDLAHAGSVAHALDYAVVLNRYRCRPDAAASLADEMIRFAEERGLSDYVGKGQLFRGWAKAMLGDTAAGVRDLLSGLAAQQTSGTPEDFPVYYDMLAEAQLASGRPDDGLVQIEEALAVGKRSGIRYWDAELLRRKAALLLAADDGDGSDAEDCLQQALSVAREQGARMLELRAATDLSRLWQRKRRPAAARDLLLPLCDWFSGGDADDLRDARALAHELG